MSKYLIKDGNVFWKKTIHYGFNSSNKQVYSILFVDKLYLATKLSLEEAKKELHRIRSCEYIDLSKVLVDYSKLNMIIIPE